MSTMSGPESTSDDRLWGALSYLPFVGWIIAIVMLVSEGKKSRPFIKFSAIQALVLDVALTVIYLVLSLVSFGILGLCLWIIFLCRCGRRTRPTPVSLRNCPSFPTSSRTRAGPKRAAFEKTGPPGAGPFRSRDIDEHGVQLDIPSAPGGSTSVGVHLDRVGGAAPARRARLCGGGPPAATRRRSDARSAPSARHRSGRGAAAACRLPRRADRRLWGL